MMIFPWERLLSKIIAFTKKHYVNIVFLKPKIFNSEFKTNTHKCDATFFSTDSDSFVIDSGMHHYFLSYL